MKMLELWKAALQDAQDMKANSGVSGFFFGNKGAKTAAEADLARVKQQLESLW